MCLIEHGYIIATILAMDYLKRTVELSKASLDAGEFPAGAVLITSGGAIYESRPSLAHNHGEMMVIDDAIQAEGAPLTGAVMYSSMQSCLMCTAKMYWAGIGNVHYVIPKSAIDASYAYENSSNTEEAGKSFFTPVRMQHDPELQEEAMSHYQSWVMKLEHE